MRPGDLIWVSLFLLLLSDELQLSAVKMAVARARSRRKNRGNFMGSTYSWRLAQALGKGGWSAASLFAESGIHQIEQCGWKSKGEARRSQKPHFHSAKAGGGGRCLPIGRRRVGWAASGTTFVLHHNEADKLNTRVLCGSGAGGSV